MLYGSCWRAAEAGRSGSRYLPGLAAAGRMRAACPGPPRKAFAAASVTWGPRSHPRRACEVVSPLPGRLDPAGGSGAALGAEARRRASARSSARGLAGLRCPRLSPGTGVSMPSAGGYHLKKWYPVLIQILHGELLLEDL